MGKILFAEQEGIYVLKFVGDVRLTLGPTISTFLEKLKASEVFRSVIIDLSETTTIDSTALGLIAKIAICTREQFNCPTSIISPREDVTRILKSMALQDICLVVNNSTTSESGMLELPHEVCSEDALRDQVLEAHRTLMSLSDDNCSKFRDLVTALESECGHQPGIRRSA